MKFFVHAAYGRGSVIFWQHCNMLCTLFLWMMSYYHMMGPLVRIKHNIMFTSLPGGVTSWMSDNYSIWFFNRMQHSGWNLLSTIDLFVNPCYCQINHITSLFYFGSLAQCHFLSCCCPRRYPANMFWFHLCI